MSNSVKRIVITGASRGIGFELAKQYLQFGATCESDAVNSITEVVATCREPEKALKLQALLESHCNTHRNKLVIEQLDVCKPESVACFKDTMLHKHIDILFNNAGIYGPNAPLLPVDLEQWYRVIHLDCMAPMFLTQQLFDNIKASELKKIVNISSDMGSIAMNTGGGAYLYRSAKAGLNAAMHSLALDVRQFDVTVLLVHPGHVITDMGGPNAKVSVEDSILGIRKVVDSATQEQSGRFFDWQGTLLPW